MMNGVVYSKRIKDYGKLEVYDTIEEGDEVRYLLVDNVRESAMFLDPELREQPVFKYQKRLKILFDDDESIKKTLMFGGAGFIYPKVYLARYPERTMDVVELMPFMEKIARDYFDLTDDPRLNVYIEDAVDYLEDTNEKYDVVLNDAFIADRMDKGLQSIGSIKRVKEHLNPDGLYVINLLGELFGEGAMPGRLFREMLGQVFENTLLLRTREDVSVTDIQNFLLIASDRELGYLAERSNLIPMED